MRSIDIEALPEDLIVQVRSLGTEESRSGGQWSLVDRRLDNNDRLLQLCADYNLFLVDANYRHSHHRCATWIPTSASQT